jgi:hypothetical protein
VLKGTSIIHPRLHETVTGWRDRGLPDCGKIERQASGDPIIDQVTLVRTPQPAVLVFEGPCTAQPAPYGDRVIVVGDAQLVIRKYVVSFGWQCPAVDIDDVVTLTKTHDPALLLRPLVVIDVQADTFQSRRMLICEDRPGRNP